MILRTEILKKVRYLGFGLGLAACLSMLSPVAIAEQTWTINSKEMDINKLILSVANATGKTIIVDRKVRGNVQVISSKPLNKKEYYELFLSILEVHGYAAVESGDVVRVIPSKDARSSPVKVSVKRPHNSSEIITQVIQLENVSATKLIPVLRPLAPQQAHMAAYSGSNAIIISDTASNINRIRKIIDKVDRSAREKTDIIPLKHASANEVVKMLKQLNIRNANNSGANKLVFVPDTRTNSIIISGDEMQRQRMKYLVNHLDTPKSQSGNVQVVYLEYAKAKDLAPVLSKVVNSVNQSSPGKAQAGGSKATIEADEGTNSLIITADTEMMSSLMSVVKRLDIRRAQVLVEAIIVEIRDDGSENLGLEWLFVDGDNGYGGFNTGGPNGALAASALKGDTTDSNGNTTQREINLGSAIASNASALLGMGQLKDSLSFNVVLKALNTKEDANILSTPSLLTLDNEEASIVVGSNIPFVTGSYTSTGNSNGSSSNPNNPFQTVKRENVGITLKITPHINEGDSLVLEIDQEASNVLASGQYGPTTLERKIATKVQVDDGKTIVLGGLLRDDINESESKVPLLGDVPFIGRAFKNTKKTVTKTHLLVFLKPTIMRDSRKLDAVSAEKYKVIRNKQLNYSDSARNMFQGFETPLLPQWQDDVKELERIRQSLRKAN